MKVLDFQRQQPEFKTPVWDYVDGLVDDERVADGKAAMASQTRALARAEERFGVSRYVLAAIWGVELDFGQKMGARPLVQSLTTLACFGERASYFRGELMATLKIVDRGDIPLDKLNGSWAGAFGQTQFMPSTFLRLAVDLDGDGRRDIVDFAAGALGSTANYLRKSGWTPGVPWGFEVKLPDGYSGPSGRKAKQPMSVWAARGITRIDGAPARRRRGGPAAAGRARGAGLPGHPQLRRRSIPTTPPNPTPSPPAILAERLAGGRGHRHALADRRSRLLPRDGRSEVQALLAEARLRRRRRPDGASAPRPRPRSPISRARTG